VPRAARGQALACPLFPCPGALEAPVSTGGRRPSRAHAMRSTLYTGGTARSLRGTPENSGGEAATFLKALDITNKEESICSAATLAALPDDHVQN
jgi:hypothetical protein